MSNFSDAQFCECFPKTKLLLRCFLLRCTIEKSYAESLLKLSSNFQSKKQVGFKSGDHIGYQREVEYHYCIKEKKLVGFQCQSMILIIQNQFEYQFRLILLSVLSLSISPKNSFGVSLKQATDKEEHDLHYGKIGTGSLDHE